MKTLRGISASRGTAVGPAYVYRPDAYDVPDRHDGDTEAAVRALAGELERIAGALDAEAARASGAAREILHAQATIARDPALRAAASSAIDSGAHPARAIIDAGEGFARDLEATRNDYLAARAPDVRHICDEAARALAGAPPRALPAPEERCVLVAEDLAPADTAALDPRVVTGIATAGGSVTSHTAVVARGLGIPAVVGIRGLLDEVGTGERLAIDGSRGELILDPDPHTIERMSEEAASRRARRARIRADAGAGPALTADGHRVEVAANVRSVDEVRAALREGAEGVGLLRTELMYVDKQHPPTEQEQIDLLLQIRRLLGRRKLVVRTFDIGSDKPVPFLPVRPERNPDLGVRGLRLARAYPELLDAQLRAVARVARGGATAVMAPMVATLEDVDWFVSRARAAGIRQDVEIGVMVEVPALAMLAAEVAERVDFMSIGTNDLTQYLFAADRRDPDLAGLQDPFDPALLRAVDAICRGARGRCWVGVCGEAASDPAWALLAVGLGVTELSMRASAIPEVRLALRHTTLERCIDAAGIAVHAPDAATTREIARGLILEIEGSELQ